MAISRKPLFMYGTGLADTKLARSVSTSVRVDPVAAPFALTSLNSAAYSALVTARGPSVRHWLVDFIVNGFTWPVQANAVAVAGRDETPLTDASAHGPELGPKRPSPVRAASMAAADAAPVATPFDSEAPSGTVAREAVSIASIRVLTAGSVVGVNPTSTSCAACAIAAALDAPATAVPGRGTARSCGRWRSRRRRSRRGPSPGGWATWAAPDRGRADQPWWPHPGRRWRSRSR